MTLESKIKDTKEKYGRVFYKEGSISFKDNQYISDSSFETANTYFYWLGSGSYDKGSMNSMPSIVGFFIIQTDNAREFNIPVLKGQSFSENDMIEFMLSQPEFEGYIEV